jgi:cysteine desulfurase
MSSVIAAAARRTEARLGNAMPIYLDNQSSTRLDPRVLEAMLPHFTEQFGNPHSTSHAYGRIAAEAVERARREVAGLINADPRELIFTSGATREQPGDQGALRISLVFIRQQTAPRYIVTLTTEHKCVLEAVLSSSAKGFASPIFRSSPTASCRSMRWPQQSTSVRSRSR